MEGEINKFVKACLSIFAALSYCYAIGKIIPKGTKRLLFVLPTICLFVLLPLKLSSINLIGVLSLFITWLANFKLVLFAFDKGPLYPSISLGRFLVVSCLPIEIRQNPPQKSSHKHLKHQDKQNPSQKKWLSSIKVLLLAILFKVFDYKEHIHQKIVLVLFWLLIYLLLETILAMVAALARAMLGPELEPQFNEPYLSTSLQDFRGRRWNLMVTRILRPTVYDPTLVLWAGLVGRRRAYIPAVIGTFLVSGLVHELLFYYAGRVRPTWEVTLFFLLHGFCLTVEIALKKAFGTTWRLPGFVSGPLTIGFLLLTSAWLFLPQLLRCEADVRLLQEYAALGGLLKRFTTQSLSRFGNLV